jgi:hypothetical protein
LEAMVDLTGGVSWKEALGYDAATVEATWRKITRYQRSVNPPPPSVSRLYGATLTVISSGILIGCALAVKGAEGDDGFGVLTNHAYSVIDAREVGGFALVKIRNPWGGGGAKWGGDWSDGCEKWDTHPRVRREVGFDSRGEGVFFMALEDFMAHFNRLYLCRVIPPHW